MSFGKTRTIKEHFKLGGSMRYKYHYLIKHDGQVIDTAQDKFIRDLMLNWLIQYHGVVWYQKITIECKRISKEDWGKLYL